MSSGGEWGWGCVSRPRCARRGCADSFGIAASVCGCVAFCASALSGSTAPCAVVARACDPASLEAASVAFCGRGMGRVFAGADAVALPPPCAALRSSGVSGASLVASEAAFAVAFPAAVSGCFPG